MEISAQNEKENILIARLRNIREMQAELFQYFAFINIIYGSIKSTQDQVAQSELNSSKLSVHRQQPNSNVFFKSTAHDETARLKLELKTAKEEFKKLAKGT